MPTTIAVPAGELRVALAGQTLVIIVDAGGGRLSASRDDAGTVTVRVTNTESCHWA
jgi:hypothetical protein